jgi:hypothetical protein
LLSAAGYLVTDAQVLAPLAAFLAGALAIAVYVGWQGILKNDLIEVDGRRGRITQSGLCASTCRSGDCAESMVPKCCLFEGKMTNLTCSSPTNRQTITPGVSHVSPRCRVNEILKAGAEGTDAAGVP